MFDDARFYCRLAENSRSYGYADCSDSPMIVSACPKDFENDLLCAMERTEEYLV